MIVTGLQPRFMLDVEVISSWAIIRSGPGEAAPSFKGDVSTQTWYRLAGLEGMKDIQSVYLCVEGCVERCFRCIVKMTT